MTPTDHAVAAMLDTFRRAPIERDYADPDLRAALGSSPPLEKMKMVSRPLEPKDFARLMDYNPETGKLTWHARPVTDFSDGLRLSAATKAKMWNTRRAGKQAFYTVDLCGHLYGKIGPHGYMAHRVAWAIHYGEWPKHEIDHINGDPADNRIENLRDVTRSINLRNSRLRHDNTSGQVGVCYSKLSNRWHVTLCKKHIGSFSTFEEAANFRLEAQANLGGFTERHGTP